MQRRSNKGVTIFLFIVFVKPDMGGLFLEHDNYTPADPGVTPAHIKPVWYFTPFYAILKAVPNPLGGMILMFTAIILLFTLPWLDRSEVKSIRYRLLPFKIALFSFVTAFVILGWLGMQSGSTVQKYMAIVCTVVYFAYFPFLYFYSKNEKHKPIPERLTH